MTTRCSISYQDVCATFRRTGKSEILELEIDWPQLDLDTQMELPPSVTVNEYDARLHVEFVNCDERELRRAACMFLGELELQLRHMREGLEEDELVSTLEVCGGGRHHLDNPLDGLRRCRRGDDRGGPGR